MTTRFKTLLTATLLATSVFPALAQASAAQAGRPLPGAAEAHAQPQAAHRPKAQSQPDHKHRRHAPPPRHGYELWRDHRHGGHVHTRHCDHRYYQRDFRSPRYSARHARRLAYRQYGLDVRHVYWDAGRWIVFGFSHDFGALRVIIDGSRGHVVGYHPWSY